MAAYRKRHSCETTILRLVEDCPEGHSWLQRDGRDLIHWYEQSLRLPSLRPYVKQTQGLRIHRRRSEPSSLILWGPPVQDDQTWVHHILSSAWKLDVKKCCPQGSSFGPLLWNIFQNDLFFEVKTATYPCTQSITNCMLLTKPLRTSSQHSMLTTRAGYHMVTKKTYFSQTMKNTRPWNHKP